jgi:hypothetical protein
MTPDDFEVDPPVTIAEVQEFCAIVKKSVPPAVFDSFVEVALRLPAAGIPAFVACAHIEAVLSDWGAAAEGGRYEVLQQLGMLYPPYGAQLAAAAAKKSREDAERLACSAAASASGSIGAPAPAALAAAPAPAANPFAALPACPAFALPGTPAPAPAEVVNQPAGGGALAPALAGPAPVAKKVIEKPISVFGFTPRTDWNSLVMPVGLQGGGLLGASGATATLPKPPSVPAIVVGARVRVREGVTPSHGWGGVTAESIGTVISIHKPAPASGPPKRGDTVKVVANTSSSPGLQPFVGQEGVIVGDDGTSNPYKIQFKDGKLGGDFYKADVEVKLDLKVQQILTRCVVHFPRGLFGL